MSANHRTKRTAIGIELVRRLAEEGSRIFTTDQARQLAASVGLKEEYLWEALHHLRCNGWIVPLRRGLYALSSAVPGMTAVHEFEIAMALVDPAAISHWSALHYHGLTEQVPRWVFVTTTTDGSVPRIRNNKPKGVDRGYPVGDTVYLFIQVKPKRYFGVQKVWAGEARVTITDPERTLLDGLTMPKYCGDFAEVLHAFEAQSADLNIDKIVSYALKLDKVTAKRLGWVLESLGVDRDQLDCLAKEPLMSYLKLDPTGPRKGPRNQRWMVLENLPGRIRA